MNITDWLKIRRKLDRRCKVMYLIIIQSLSLHQKKLEISFYVDQSFTRQHLESDMLELRNLLTEVNSVMKGLQQLSINFDQAKSGKQKKLQTEIVKDLRDLLDLPDKLDIAITQRQF